MKIFVFILNILGVLALALWFCFEPSWESGATTFGGVIALISHFFWNNEVQSVFFKKKQIEKMSQKAGNNSNQYQSGGDMTINK